METLLHDPDGGRPYPTPGVDNHPLDLVLRPVLCPRHVPVRRRLLLRAARRPPSTCSRTSACRATCTPQIQATSLVGEIYRYQVVGPPHFGLTNLRTVQDWILQRRLLDRPRRRAGQHLGRHHQAIRRRCRSATSSTPTTSRCRRSSARIGNANINVGGRTINIGQQSVNIRGVGLIDSGGADDLTKGYKVQDIENVLLDAVERRADPGEGRRQGLGRLCAAARQGRPRPRGRRRRRDRHHEPHAAHQRRRRRASRPRSRRSTATAACRRA